MNHTESEAHEAELFRIRDNIRHLTHVIKDETVKLEKQISFHGEVAAILKKIYEEDYDTDRIAGISISSLIDMTCLYSDFLLYQTMNNTKIIPMEIRKDYFDRFIELMRKNEECKGRD